MRLVFKFFCRLDEKCLTEHLWPGLQQSKLYGIAIAKDTSPSQIIKDVRCIMSEVETRKNLAVRLRKETERGMNCYEIENPMHKRNSR
jgi:hypothetical protein